MRSGAQVKVRKGAQVTIEIGRRDSRTADLIEQVKMVAGGGFEPPTFRL